MVVMRAAKVIDPARLTSSTPSRELMGEKRTIVTATLVSVGVVAAGAQLAVTVLLLLLHGLVRHWNTFVVSDTTVEHTHNNATHTHEVLDELTYLSDAFRTYPAFSLVVPHRGHYQLCFKSCVAVLAFRGSFISQDTERGVERGYTERGQPPCGMGIFYKHVTAHDCPLQQRR